MDDYREASDSIKDDSDYDDASDVDSEVLDDGDRPRRSHHHWDGRWDFVSAQIVYNMHLNILWRFPYMILSCGGGAFVILVIILSFMFGLPMLVLEASLGQMTRSGPVRAMERVCSLAQGLGVAMSSLTFLTSVYTSLLGAWSLKLMAASSNVPLLWTSCDKVWSDNTSCIAMTMENNTMWESEKSVFQSDRLLAPVPALNLKGYFEENPLEQYFYRRILGQKLQSLSSFVILRGEIASCLFVVWMWLYFCVWKRRRTFQISRQIQMLTFCLFPICMTFGFIRRDMGNKALQFMFQPKMQDFQNLTPWCCALGYVCNLYGLGFGVPMELAASNPFNYEHLLSDIFIQVVVGVSLSLMVGFTITLHAAKIAITKDIQIGDLGYTIESVFLVIMDGLSDNALPQVCLILFFIFFFITSLNTLLFQLDLAISAIQDNFWKVLNKYFKAREILSGRPREKLITVTSIALTGCVCAFGFVLALVFSTRAGLFNLLLVDLHLAILGPPLLIIFELFFVINVHGLEKWSRNVCEMTDIRLSSKSLLWFKIIIPFILIAWTLGVVVSEYFYLSKIFPKFAIIGGLLILLLPSLLFLVLALTKFRVTEGKTVKTKLRIGLQSNLQECSCHKLLRGCPFRRYL